MDSFNRFMYTHLPPKDRFLDKLNDAHFNDSQYKHDQLIWTEFHCETLMDYHNIYLMNDVLLFKDYFEKFRDTCI